MFCFKGNEGVVSSLINNSTLKHIWSNMNPSFFLNLTFDNFLFWVHEKETYGFMQPVKKLNCLNVLRLRQATISSIGWSYERQMGTINSESTRRDWSSIQSLQPSKVIFLNFSKIMKKGKFVVYVGMFSPCWMLNYS